MANVKNLDMDYILLSISLYSFFRGCFKGFVSMIFSFVGTFAIIFVSWKLCDLILPLFQNWVGGSLSNMISQILNGMLPGEFSDLESLKVAISESKYAILFNILLFKVLGNLTIDGEMTAGQILSPTISSLLVKILTFVLLFVALHIVLRIVASILNKIVKKCGFTLGNRVLGGVVGLLKGLLIFGALYFALVALANFLLNETLLNFVQNGTISNLLYNNLISKIIDLIY